MEKLTLKVVKKEYPYDELYDPEIYWAEIVLAVVSDRLQVLKEIFRLQWDAREFLNWLITGKENILYDEFPIKMSADGSLAAKIHSFYGVEEEINEEALDEMFKYRQSHGVRFGLRGTDVIEVYLGKNDGVHEISFYDKNESWRYELDLTSFYDGVESYFCNIVQ